MMRPVRGSGVTIVAAAAGPRRNTSGSEGGFLPRRAGGPAAGFGSILCTPTRTVPSTGWGDRDRTTPRGSPGLQAQREGT